MAAYSHSRPDVTAIAWIMIVVGGFRTFQSAVSLSVEFFFNSEPLFSSGLSFFHVTLIFGLVFGTVAMIYGSKLLMEPLPKDSLKYVVWTYIVVLGGISIYSLNLVLPLEISEIETIRHGQLKSLFYMGSNLVAAVVEAILVLWAFRRLNSLEVD